MHEIQGVICINTRFLICCFLLIFTLFGCQNGELKEDLNAKKKPNFIGEIIEKRSDNGIVVSGSSDFVDDKKLIFRSSKETVIQTQSGSAKSISDLKIGEKVIIWFAVNGDGSFRINASIPPQAEASKIIVD